MIQNLSFSYGDYVILELYYSVHVHLNHIIYTEYN